MFNKLRLWFHRTFGKCKTFGEKERMFIFVPTEKAYIHHCLVCGKRHQVVTKELTPSQMQHYHKQHRDAIEKLAKGKVETKTVDKAVDAVAKAAEKPAAAMREVSFPNAPRKPNRKTRRAMAQLQRRNNPVSYAGVDEFMDEVQDYCEADTASTLDED